MTNLTHPTRYETCGYVLTRAAAEELEQLELFATDLLANLDTTTIGATQP